MNLRRRTLFLLLSLVSVSFVVSFSMLKSSCLCGQVSVSLPASDHLPTGDCHCRSCRRYHVAAFTSFVLAPKNDVTVSGETSTYRDACFEAGIVDRVYCPKCYSKMVTRPVAGANYQDQVFVNMGPLQNETIPGPLAREWKRERQQWQLEQKIPWGGALPLARSGSSSSSEGSEGRERRPRVGSLHGGCACGKTRYRIVFDPPKTELQHCYCQMCRQLSGAPFMTWMPVDNDHWEWNGEPKLVRTTTGGQRHICEDCGGVVTIVYDDDPDATWPAAGSLDDTSLPQEDTGKSLYRVVHICCRYKQVWYEIPKDGLKRIAEAS